MKKALVKLTADTLQKLGIVGIALAIFQGKTEMEWVALLFLAGSYVLTALEARK